MSTSLPVAVITGAGGAIGRAAALRLARDGFAIACLDVHAGTAAETAAAVVANGGSAASFVADITQAEAVQAAIDAVAARFGRIDVLVNNAGMGRIEKLQAMPLASWNETLATNLTGAFLCAQAAARHMVAAGGGRIVNVSSAHANKATPGRGAYASSKAALVALTRLLAVELSGRGVRANGVSFGPIATPRGQALSDEQRRFYESTVPLGRLGTLEEAAGAIAFLASPRASFINGHTLEVDGGFTAAGVLSERMLDIHVGVGRA
jgi:NAD(P)-dependent dehydrogenase (short-subunit alcohol dehydrogenase family)